MRDILLDPEDRDLLFENGDLVIGVSDNQHQMDILRANKGDFKQHPEVGVGIEQILNDDNYDEVLIEVKKQLEYDGMKIKNIRFLENGKLFIDGKYNNNG